MDRKGPAPQGQRQQGQGQGYAEGKPQPYMDRKPAPTQGYRQPYQESKPQPSYARPESTGRYESHKSIINTTYSEAIANLKQNGFTLNEDRETLHQLRINPDSEGFHFPSRFREMATFLLNHSALLIGGKRHRFLEIEFYYYDDVTHPDIYSHHSEVQHTFANWYFHTWVRGGETVYRDGAQTGVDISIGGQRGGTDCGGILIRSIMDSYGKVYCGPGAVMNRVLQLLRCHESVQNLVDLMQRNLSITNEKGPFHIVLEDQPPLPLYQSARVGLYLTKEHFHTLEEMTNYVFKEYRFFLQPSFIFKGIHYIALSLHQQGMATSEICALIATKKGDPQRKPQELAKWIRNFQYGKSTPNILQTFVGRKLDEDETCRAIGAVLALN
eukprot:TRINITY_DN1715_c0_g1_i1.p1 TRINITY_DN1715_c0_g1~~TRINITY_DN1715_c0_g1_i1.p1  ORF type:complete len:384 (+),score=60.58 TRINITY_DN1715_c0_g1_i1:1-1152(+)